MKRVAVAIAVGLICGTAYADEAEDRADRAYRAAIVLSPADALTALEELGAQRPATRWTDNAWSEAAHLAEVAGDVPRARANLEHVIAEGTDPQLVQRARASLVRLAPMGDGSWDAVAKQHVALLAEVNTGDDPDEALAKLGALVRAHPTYPRATSVRVAIARGWELEGQRDKALTWMREAASAAGEDPGERTRLELARMLVRTRELAEARAVIAALRTSPRVDRAARDEVMRMIDAASRRAWIRRGIWFVFALLGATALVVLRRDRGSWRSSVRALVPPPLEVVMLVPLLALLVGLSASGNPLVSRAVISIAVAGLGVAWLSAAVGTRGRSGRRVLLHVVALLIAVGGISYLAIERGVLDLLVETWHGGHALP